MSLSKKHALELMKLGFKRQDFEEKVYPTDIIDYNGETWVVGGRILPNGNLLCDKNIYTKGDWLPSQEDLISWLEDNDCTFVITYGGTGYKTEITAINSKVYKGKGGTLEYSLYNAIVNILKELCGNPVHKSYKIVEAELISRDDT